MSEKSKTADFFLSQGSCDLSKIYTYPTSGQNSVGLLFSNMVFNA